MTFELDESRLLYEEGNIKIYQAEIPEEHDLIVGDTHCYLPRGILRECAITDKEGLMQRLEAINSIFLNQLIKRGAVSLECLGWAISKARIIELEQEVSYFIPERLARIEADEAIRILESEGKTEVPPYSQNPKPVVRRHPPYVR